MFDVSGKVVVVTGGGKGIGNGIAMGFAKAGAKVAIWDLDLQAAQEAAEEIVKGGGQAVAFKADVTSSEDVEAAVAGTLQAFNGRIDVLVNNAGFQGGSDLIWKMTPEAFRKTIDIDLTSIFIVSQKVAQVMIKQKYGRIINISSTSSKRICHLGGAHYTAAKSGVNGLTRHMAIDLGAYGITVNAVCPGGTATETIKEMWGPQELKRRQGEVPMGRMPMPEDHFYACLFFASDEAGIITAQALDVDGGALLNFYDNETYHRLMGEPLGD